MLQNQIYDYLNHDFITTDFRLGGVHNGVPLLVLLSIISLKTASKNALHTLLVISNVLVLKA